MNQNAQSEALFSALPGEMLREARIKAEMTLEQIAKELNLDLSKIEALEASKFVELGAPVYVKGYLRKYARLVSLPESDLLKRYDAFDGASPDVVPVPVSHNLIPEQRPFIPRWGWVVVWVLVGVAIAASLLNLRGTKNDVSADMIQSQGVVAESIAQGSPIETAQTETTQVGTTKVTNSVDSAQSVSVQLPVKFRFSENSWIEVKDAQGQQVIYENVSAGQVRSISAVPPLQVTLGSVSAVTVEVNAKSVAIPAERITQNVAHFVLNAAGLVE